MTHVLINFPWKLWTISVFLVSFQITLMLKYIVTARARAVLEVFCLKCFCIHVDKRMAFELTQWQKSGGALWDWTSSENLVRNKAFPIMTANCFQIKWVGQRINTVSTLISKKLSSTHCSRISAEWSLQLF